MAPLDLLENLEMMVKLANLENQVSVDLRDLRELVDSRELLVCLASRGTEVIRGVTVQRGRLELLVLRVNLVLLERAALPDQWDLVVCLVREDVLEPVELLELVEMMAWPVLLVHLAPLDPPELQASLARPVQKEKPDLLVLVDLRVLRDLVESLVLLDLLDPLALLVIPVLMASLERKDLLVLLASLVLLVSLDLVGLPGLREPLDLLVQREHLETRVSQGSRERLDPKEKLDHLVFRDQMAH